MTWVGSEHMVLLDSADRKVGSHVLLPQISLVSRWELEVDLVPVLHEGH